MRPPLSSGWSSSVFNQRMCTLGCSCLHERSARDHVARDARAFAAGDDVPCVLAVEKNPLPHLEIDQRPETFAVVLAAQVRGGELPNDLRLEQVARHGALAEHVF